VSGVEPEAITKDYRVLAMLAVMGGERREVNERDLFLACWHAFPNAMRWTDTALPNPDTFTASLRRLDADGLIERIGKQERTRRKSRRRQAIEVGRSGVVKARIRDGALEKAGLTTEAIERVRRLVPPPDTYRAVDDATLITLCIRLRREEQRHVDEGALVETAFHKFPAAFSYGERPEFPDTARIKDGLAQAIRRGLVTKALDLTDDGHDEIERHENLIELRLDASESHKTGAFKLAERIAAMPGYEQYQATKTLSATKADELFRALRVAPTTDPRPVAQALVARSRDLRRIDKGEIAEYLYKVAERHNPEVTALLADDDTQAVVAAETTGGEE
jgi:hypothetical protein